MPLPLRLAMSGCAAAIQGKTTQAKAPETGGMGHAPSTLRVPLPRLRGRTLYVQPIATPRGAREALI
jgi:hypothetical protein